MCPRNHLAANFAKRASAHSGAHRGPEAKLTMSSNHVLSSTILWSKSKTKHGQDCQKFLWHIKTLQISETLLMVAQNKKQMLYVLHICNFLQKSRGLPYSFICEEYIHYSSLSVFDRFRISIIPPRTLLMGDC